MTEQDFIKLAKRIDRLERDVWVIRQELDLIKAVLKKIGEHLESPS